MTAKKLKDIEGYEYDWLAHDRVGFVAMFSTAGGGVAPDVFLNDTGAHDRAIDAILELPPTTEAELATELRSGLPNRWKAMALRGFFSFDADPNGGPYRLESAPAVPLLLSQLPQSVASVVMTIRFTMLQFDVAKKISSADVRRVRQSWPRATS